MVRRTKSEALETREQIIDAIRPAFSPFVDGALVRFTAACWWVSARNDGESWRS